jgi:hypothetical protein
VAAAREDSDPDLISVLEQIGTGVAAAYRQAERDLADPERVSFIGTAAELREVLTAVLRALAPDEAIKAKPGWKPETKDERPTRRQRSEFIFMKQQSSREVRTSFEHAIEGLDHLAGDLYARASKATHCASADRGELKTLAGYVRSLLRDLLLHAT